MGLQVSTPVLGGQVTGTYWKITNILVNVQTLVIRPSLGLYLDQASADSGTCPPLAIKNFRLSIQPSDLSGNIIALAYNKIIADANIQVQTGVDENGNPIMGPKDSCLASATLVSDATES